MNLTEQEVQVINTRLKKCRTLYREIFEELYDHILSLIELKRESGDSRDIAVVLQEVIDIDFEGDRGLHRIALRRFTLYRSGLWSTLWGFIKQNRVPFWVLIILILSLAYFEPYSRVLNIALTTNCFILAVVPLAYLLYNKGFKGVFYTGSIKLSTIGTYAIYPLNMFTIIFCMPLIVTKLVEGHSRDCPVVVSGFALVCALAYTVGFIQFCNQEIKQVSHQ